MQPTSESDEFFLDPQQVRRSFDVAAATFDAFAGVHAEIRTRLLERLEVVRIQPKLILDIGAGTGIASRALKQHYGSAHVVAIDSSAAMLQQASKRRGWRRGFSLLRTDANALGLKTGCTDLIFSNLMLQWCNEPHQVFAEMQRVLRVGGLLSFATLGPDSLRELRGGWRHIDRTTHVNRFIDMHDLGDVLMRTGFSEPVMDTERLTVTHTSVDKLVAELRNTGSRNVNAGRPRGLRASSIADQLRQRMEAHRRDGVLATTLEVVYGHAWIGEPRAAAHSGEVGIPISQIRRRR